jgi:hypothetical protein
MARDALSPWSDWKPIPTPGLIYNTRATIGGADNLNVGPGAISALGILAADQFDGLFPNVAALLAQPALVAGGASPKPTFPRGVAASAGTAHDISWYYQIPIPNYVSARQRGRFTSWSGDLGATEGLNGDPDGSRRVALNVETILASRNNLGVGSNLAATVPPFTTLNPPGFGMSAKFRGYGAPTISVPVTVTEDTPVGGLSVGVAGSVFLDMDFPSDDADPTGNAAVTFGPDGIARLQHLVEMTNTIDIGDVVELTWRMIVPVAAVIGEAAVQLYGLKYRWVIPPFDFAVNSGVQLVRTSTVDETQPRLDLTTNEP